MGMTAVTPVHPSHQTLKLLLVEDSRVLADRLIELIDQTATVELVAQVDNERDASALLRNSPIDVVILDLQLRQGTGFGVLKSLPRTGRRPRVIVLTNFDLPAYRREATELGADYFLDKSREYHRVPEILETLSLSATG
jgi:two-component system, OmpR family, response regulator